MSYRTSTEKPIIFISYEKLVFNWSLHKTAVNLFFDFNFDSYFLLHFWELNCNSNECLIFTKSSNLRQRVNFRSQLVFQYKNPLTIRFNTYWEDSYCSYLLSLLGKIAQVLIWRNYFYQALFSWKYNGYEHFSLTMSRKTLIW